MEQFISARGPKVVWYFDAFHQMKQLVGPTELKGHKNAFELALKCTFSKAQIVEPRAFYYGFFHIDNRFTLLVDVMQDQNRGRYVVKACMGPMTEEVRAAWMESSPPAVSYDPVLMPLVAGYNGAGVFTAAWPWMPSADATC